MKLVEFSVSNYRSITTAHKIKLKNLTVLVGKNNEGKSNLLRALNVAMSAVVVHSRQRIARTGLYTRKIYNWEQDFPIQYQQRKNGLESIFKLNFRLENEELGQFHSQLGIRGNEDIPISVKIGRDNLPKIEVPKRGSSSYNRKSREITEFISTRIAINYIQAVRTETMALNALRDAIKGELSLLRDNKEYVKAQRVVYDLQQEALNRISQQLIEPLNVFLPNLKSVEIRQLIDYDLPYVTSRDFDVIVDDGLATSIRNKGDGIKSLITLAILKDRRNIDGASVVAIEEPESHLHSGAIHALVDVIHKMSENNQVIISTHNPLFVQQNQVNSNIIVEAGTAHPAKSISEIREILGVLPSDNLRNARYVLLVEGEDDKISLSKILPVYSEKIKAFLSNNQLVIKSLGGASNLTHDAADLKNCMCKFVALLDNDKAGQEAAKRAMDKGVILENQIKYTICNGSPESEFEDCLKPSTYINIIFEKFGVKIDVPEFKGSQKWSDRLKKVFLSQGSRWSETIESKLKYEIAISIPDSHEIQNIDDIIIEQKSSFIMGLVSIIEAMLDES